MQQTLRDMLTLCFAFRQSKATDQKFNHGVLKVILHMILGTNHNMMRWLDQIAKNNINVV